ncbi:MAG: carbohydrate porin [Acidobacteria bacterium]|nr:carbohydrate porin [Acidobacteriota bacterium]MBS1867689.1 carbohydrate porin [Acidobacteriota bacterium]
MIRAKPEPEKPIVLLPKFFSQAARKGIYFHAFLNEELAANPSGGIDQGATASQYVTFGTGIDLERLIGWRGGALHAIVIALSSNGLSLNHIGGGIDVQENATPFNLVRALNFTLEQNISLGEKNNLNLIAGRVGATPYFMGNDLACLFMNHAFCGMMYGFYQSTLSSVSPAPSWGGRAKFNVTPKTYVEFGGYAIDLNTVQASTSIFTWNTRGVTGINYLAEAGHATTLAEQNKPHYFRVGVSYVDGPRPDVLLNTNGLPLFQFGGTPLSHYGETAFYATGAQVIQRTDRASRRNVALFGSIYYNFADSEAIKYAIKGGVVKTGTFGKRPGDTLGFAVSPVAFTDKQVEFLSGMRAKGGGVGRVPSHEVVFEANYGYRLASGVVLRPNVQYIVNPDSRYTPTFPRDIPNVFAVGLQINANLDALFGLPHH